MQIKTPVRYYVTPVRMAGIKKVRNVATPEASCVAGGNVKRSSRRGSQCGICSKSKQDFHIIQQSHFWVCTQKNWQQGLKRIKKTHGHSHVSHNSWKVETTQVSVTDEWMNKVWPTEYSASKKEGHLDTRYEMDESWGRHAEWREPVANGRVPWDATHASHKNGQTQRQEVGWGPMGAGHQPGWMGDGCTEEPVQLVRQDRALRNAWNGKFYILGILPQKKSSCNFSKPKSLFLIGAHKTSHVVLSLTCMTFKNKIKNIFLINMH